MEPERQWLLEREEEEERRREEEEELLEMEYEIMMQAGGVEEADFTAVAEALIEALIAEQPQMVEDADEPDYEAIAGAMIAAVRAIEPEIAEPMDESDDSDGGVDRDNPVRRRRMPFRLAPGERAKGLRRISNIREPDGLLLPPPILPPDSPPLQTHLIHPS